MAWAMEHPVLTFILVLLVIVVIEESIANICKTVMFCKGYSGKEDERDEKQANNAVVLPKKHDPERKAEFFSAEKTDV